MTKVVEAVYDGEVFKPLKRVNLPKGAKVKVIIGPTIVDLLKKYQFETSENIEEVLEDVRGRKKVYC